MKTKDTMAREPVCIACRGSSAVCQAGRRAGGHCQEACRRYQTVILNDDDEHRLTDTRCTSYLS